MPVIAIAGMPGCGSSTTARLLAEKLGLRIFIAGNYFKSFAQGKETERAVKFWETKEANKKDFHLKLDGMQREEALRGNVVIEAKLAFRMLKGLTDYKVWLTAPKEVRIKRYANRDSIPPEEAKELLKKKEDLEKTKYKKIYGFNLYEQSKEADLTIDTSSMTPEEIVNTIITALKDAKIIK